MSYGAHEKLTPAYIAHRMGMPKNGLVLTFLSELPCTANSTQQALRQL